MYKEAFELVQEVLQDREINRYISENTGKNLAVINAGAQVTTPSATVTFANGDFTRAINTKKEVGYNVSFALPFWGNNAFDKCIDFLDFVIPVFFEYRTKNCFIKSAAPSVVEQDSERKFWIINIYVIVEVLI